MAHSDTDVVMVLTTVPPDLDIEGLARRLLKARLVACVNVLAPMRSVYRWRGALEEARERQVVMKTTRGRVRALEVALTSEHPYDVPEFLVLPVGEGGAAYLAWVRAETVPDARADSGG